LRQLELLLVTICRCSVNPGTNPNPLYSYTKNVTVFTEGNGEKKEIQRNREIMAVRK
jgi:hypothetical protein